VDFETAGATLALNAMPDPGRRGVQLRFSTADIDARVRELEVRGVRFDAAGVQRFEWGRLIGARDPEENPFTIWQPAMSRSANAGPVLSAVINCRDLEAQKRFYRDTLGFAATTDSPWWVQLAVGEAGLGLHPLVERPGAERHHGRPLSIGFAIPGLAAWFAEASERGLEFTSPPTDRGYGTFADAVDPDGNEITFRDVPEPMPLEEELAEEFEDDRTPHLAPIRKPVKVKKAAVSAGRPAAPPAAREPLVGKAKPTRKRVERVASPRGTGPAGARRKPKRRHDPKRARTKPAIGRLRKAERRTLDSKKKAVASASKGKVPRMPRKKVRRAQPVRGRR
jgi:predicted enzyme related to lactoylglutathione lyase